MTREDFETEYAWRHMKLSFMHNPADAVEAVRQYRSNEGYTDKHMDLCWKVQKLKNYCASGGAFLNKNISSMEW
jgi:hypothetical protein